MTDCPPAEHLLEFAAGKLSDDSLAGLEKHIDDCVACRSALSSLAKADTPSTSFGRYRLENVLGSGGMGIVYRAFDPQLARQVAIKVVRQAGGDAQLRTRLVREAQSLARLSHPNVCHVYDVGTDDEEVWLAMELIEGTTLRAWAAGKSFDEILAALLGAAEGIAAAHASGLIHRDIKPENVLVTHAGRPVVTDFGLARVDVPVDPKASTQTGDPLMTATGAIVGTPAYLAPEQLTGDVLDARVDQFAWAVMAWELLTGTRPFPIIAAIRLDAIRAGITAPPSLPKPIAAALVRAMALNARDRFPSMRELIDALKTEPERASRVPVIVGGAAVLAVAATVITWRKRSPDEPPPKPAPVVVAMMPDAAAPDAAAPDAATIVETTPPPPDGPAAPPPVPKQEPKPKAKPTEVAAAPIPQPPAPQPAPPQQPLRPLNNPSYSVTRAYASMVAWCRIPVDVKNPDPALGKHGVVDWGPVTRKEKVIATLVDRESYMILYEVKGQRRSYQFSADDPGAGVFGILDVPVGQQLALCIDPGRPERNEMYKLPANWSGGLDILASAFPTKGTPVVDQLKKWNPVMVDALKLEISGDKGKLQIKPASHYLVRAKPFAKDGARWDMKNWWIETGNAKGADLVQPGKLVWFVIAAPEFEGDKLVAKAVLVLDEIIPH